MEKKCVKMPPKDSNCKNICDMFVYFFSCFLFGTGGGGGGVGGRQRRRYTIK